MRMGTTISDFTSRKHMLYVASAVTSGITFTSPL